MYKPFSSLLFCALAFVLNAYSQDTGFFLFLYGDPAQAFGSFLRPELLKQYDRWMDEAEQAVAGKPEALERVKRARLSIDYAILEASRRQLSDDLSLVEKGPGGKPATPEKLGFSPVKGRYVKIKARNMGKAPIWRHGAGLPAWIFADEVQRFSL